MDKLVSNKGYTLIEVLLVVSVLMICILVFPVVKQTMGIPLQYQMQQLQLKLVWAQRTAIREKKTVYIKIQGQIVEIDTTSTKLASSITCETSHLHFTPLGNVSQAMRIHCSSNGKRKQIVVQLGTGRMYVK